MIIKCAQKMPHSQGFGKGSLPLSSVGLKMENETVHIAVDL